MEKRKILLLTTGGTIASAATEEGLAPNITGEGLKQFVGGMLDAFDVTVRDILHLDSSNMQPEEWEFIARTVYENYRMFDGIVITHGTDTMSYTAAALSFMLQGIPISVVLTGAQLPITHPLSDATDNLRTAFAMAAAGYGGVYLAFDRRVILGTRAVKTHTMNFGAFDSVNAPFAAEVNAHGLVVNEGVLPQCDPDFRLQADLCRAVFLLKLVPGTDPRIFDMLMKMGIRGIVIEAFGAGGVQFIRRDLTKKLNEVICNGISVVVCSQCLYERSDFSLYEVGQRALEQGVIQTFDMTSEAAVTKLMWVLGRTQNREEVAQWFATDLVGEISLNLHK